MEPAKADRAENYRGNMTSVTCPSLWQVQLLRENLHQSNPPIPIMATPKIRLMPTPPVDWDCAPLAGGVPVGAGCVMEGEGENRTIVGLGVVV